MSAGEIKNGGWRLDAGFASNVPPGAFFYAVYEGSAFGQADRGILAAIACAHHLDPGDGKGGGEAAQLVMHEFAEGYFGARRTLSAKRAAHHALQSINTWLFDQIRNDTHRHLAPVSLSAIIFSGAQIAVAHIGACRLYRRRQGVVTPLIRVHGRIGQQGKFQPVRAIGLDLEIAVDYADDRAEAGDQYLLLSGMNEDSHDVVETAFALNMPRGKDAELAAIVIDVVAAPAPDAQVFNKALANLPLRPEPRSGDVWDGFEIGKTIYRGRYTILKFARDSVKNCEVVLKIPLPSMLQDEVFAAGFMREAWVGSTVQGNVVARYIELPPERRSSLYLVMPYYYGETLEARLHHPPPVSLPDGIGIALKLCEAVQDLAAIQIIHRDIKPDNIMLLKHNEVKLLDLGLAYLPGIDLQDSVKPGGTLRYMAPELLKGVQANARSEVYALGVTIYRMFAAGPFPFGQREELPLKRMRPDLPSWLGRVLQKALAAELGERYADAGEMAAALNAGLLNGPQDNTARRRFPALTKLRIYQLLTVVFAAGFFILLARSLR